MSCVQRVIMRAVGVLSSQLKMDVLDYRQTGTTFLSDLPQGRPEYRNDKLLVHDSRSPHTAVHVVGNSKGCCCYEEQNTRRIDRQVAEDRPSVTDICSGGTLDSLSNRDLFRRVRLVLRGPMSEIPCL